MKWLKKKSEIQNHNWYIWLMLLLTTASFLITLFAVVKPVQEIKREVQNINDLIYNPQEIDTSKLSPDKLIEKYYEFLNNSKYIAACSLRSKGACDVNDIEKLAKWSEDKQRYYERKMANGERVANIWKASEQIHDQNSELWCAKLISQIDGEGFEKQIEQIWRYRILTKNDDTKEITVAHCEKAIKEGNDRSVAMGCTSNANCINNTP